MGCTQFHVFMKMNFSLPQNQEYNKVIYIDKIHENEVEALGFMKTGREAKIHEKIKFNDWFSLFNPKYF